MNIFLVFTNIIYVCKTGPSNIIVMGANRIQMQPFVKAGPSNIIVTGANMIQMQLFVKSGPSSIIVMGANRIQMQLKVLNYYTNNINTKTIQIINDAGRVC